MNKMWYHLILSPRMLKHSFIPYARIRMPGLEKASVNFSETYRSYSVQILKENYTSVFGSLLWSRYISDIMVLVVALWLELWMPRRPGFNPRVPKKVFFPQLCFNFRLIFEMIGYTDLRFDITCIKIHKYSAFLH